MLFTFYFFCAMLILKGDDKMKASVIKKTTDEILKVVKGDMTGAQYFLFKTTMERYITQLNLMSGMQENWEREGLTVEKNYSGKPAMATHPLIQDYNKTASAASTTVNALLKILDKAKLPEDKQTHIADLMDRLSDE